MVYRYTAQTASWKKQCVVNACVCLTAVPEAHSAIRPLKRELLLSHRLPSFLVSRSLLVSTSFSDTYVIIYNRIFHDVSVKHLHVTKVSRTN